MLALVKPAAFQIREILQHPAVLLGMVLLGGWVGALFPGSAPTMAAVATLYLSLIQMAAFPFVLLAMYFGLQRLPAVPNLRGLLVRLLVMSLLAMLACAAIGILVASVSSAGGHMSPEQTTAFGKLALRSESSTAMSMFGSEAATRLPWESGTLLPDNLFGVLAYGSMPSVLIGVLLFGAAVAVQAPGSASSLSAIFEAAYRALESLVQRFNNFLPVGAFVMAATATATAGVEAIVLLGGFLAAFVTGVLIVSMVMIGLISYRLKTSPLLVLAALREPLTVCLFSPVAVAAIPGLIDSMSARLGYSRGLVELCAPIAPVFIKAGEAMFFGVMAVFVANLYGHPLGAGAIVWIGFLSFAAAMLSVGITGAKSVVLGGFVMASLGLPLEAVLPVFMLVEVLCEGARNLLSLLISSGLIALVADGLYIDHAQDSEDAGLATLSFLFSRKQLWLIFLLISIALASVFAAGIGFGLHKAV